MKKYLYLCFVVILFASCKTSYVSKSFNEAELSAAPNYSKIEYWAVHPSKITSQLKEFMPSDTAFAADVFFVYPTLLIDKKNDAWNADVNDSIFNNEILDKSIHFQASAWAGAGRIFSPFYRQSHYRIYVEPYTKQSGSSYEIAYNDVKNAFEYYLKYYNKGRPIIIAAHSQGSAHCKRLLKEYFDGKPLQKQLIAAYIPGIKVVDSEFQNLKPMTNAYEIGGYVSWNSFRKNKYPKSFEKWFKGGVTSNPISWNHQNYTDIKDHKGVLYTNNKIYEQSLSVEVKDGILWVSVPKIPKRIFLRLIKNYHFADINLFWKDISINAQNRVDIYLKNSN
ncbi:DUF3089 domain-containing protein [Lutibacter sp.]|uniref:DUF3089 domain-containing protein n=1 Tax=Lutibacter sp. TaxID=1925666 RepID=UPI0027333019|nr:DUF3089 domain-containing protein [Lutibacter sp.]MDP3311793.1 DUF3089 domain-containing protein [Lutibacter sp.]